MSLAPLIENQTLRIDNHNRADGRPLVWDRSSDVHIDKETNGIVDGKRQKVRMRIPINSDKPISVENARGDNIPIPRRIEREIKRTLENEEKRGAFIKSVVEVLGNYEASLSDEEKAKEALTNISKHFGLEWPEKTITTFINDALAVYGMLFYNNGNEYFAEMDMDKIVIGQYSGYSKRYRSYYRLEQ